jgi:hypothetical protein
MKNTVQVRYHTNMALYRAEFYQGGTAVGYKNLTNDEADAISEINTLPSEGELLIFPADFLRDELEQIGSIDFESNLMVLLGQLAR